MRANASLRVPMPRLLRLTATVLAATLLALTLARVLSPEQRSLAAVTATQTDCAPPCWLGIQPGVSTIGEATAALAAHPWVADYRVNRTIALESGYLFWTWSGAQPDTIDGGKEGVLWFEDRRVIWLQVATRIPFGAFWQEYGPPSSSSTWHVELTTAQTFHRAHYSAHALLVEFDVACPARVQPYWSAAVRLRFGARAGEPGAFRPPRWGSC